MLRFLRSTVSLLAALIFAAEAQGQVRSVTDRTIIAQADRSPNLLVVDHANNAIQYPARLLVRQQSLEVALSQLYRAAGVPLLFSPSLIPAGHKVDCDCLGVSVGEALDLLLAGTGLDYINHGGQVIIAPAAPASRPARSYQRDLGLNLGSVTPSRSLAGAKTWVPRTVQIQNGTLSGRVIENQSRQPLPSVQVFLPRLRIGTLTGADGRFILANVPPGTHQVRAERIGFQPATAQVTVRSAATATVELTMSEQALALDEIIVTGTAGQARRREVGNSITRIDVVRLDKGGRTDPTPNLDQLLQAQGPGISVTQSGQSLGSGARIRLRGDNSVAMGNQPLLFIDGIRMHNNSPPTNTPIDGSGARGAHVHVSPMNDINPDDIERIEIIKGAAATTLYGTEASSGVIQIFTKRGKTGGTVWSAQMDYGVDTPRKFAPEPEPYMRLDCCFVNGERKRLAVSVAGGTDALRYFMSGGFQDNTGILPVDSQQVVNLRGNFSIQLTQKLTLDYNTGWTSNFMRHTPAGNNSQGLTTIAFRDKSSSIGANWRDRIEEIYKWEITNDHNHIVTGLTANYQFTEKLSNRLTVGIDRLTAEMRNVRPYGFIVDPIGIVNNGQWGQQNVTFDFASNLALEPRSDLSATLSAGAQLLRKAEFTVNAYSDNLPGPGVPTVSSGARFLASERRQKEVTGGGFGQALLGFRDRYFLTLGLRVDGSSAFGENFGFQPYPKASLSYVISEEGFWPDALGDVKLRAAYGHAGRAPGAFDAGRTWQPVGFGGAPAFYPGQVGNPDLGPERTAEIELGFDATLLGGRASIEFTAYNQTVSDALFPVSQSPSLGFGSSQLMNVGKVGNKGLELGLKGTPIEASWGGWDVGVSFTSQKNKVIDLGGAPETGSIREGEPVPVVIGTKLMNRDALAEPIFVTDYVFGPRQPTKMFSVSTSLRLPRGIELSGRGEFMGGHFITIGGIGQTASRRAWPECEVRAYEYLAARRRAELTAYEILMCDTALPGGSFPETYAADFFRVRDISLRFPIPTRILGAASVTISARNYWTKFFKDWFFADPEILARGGEGSGLETLGGGIGEDTPPPRMFTVSVKTTF